MKPTFLIKMDNFCGKYSSRKIGTYNYTKYTLRAVRAYTKFIAQQSTNAACLHSNF